MCKAPLRIVVLATALSLSGCATGARLESEHVSHPFAGQPFGDRTEEDALNQLSAILEWHRDNGWYAEAGLGYVISDSGFYGPPLTFTFRAGRRFDFNK
jgi:hypothetical protein